MGREGKKSSPFNKKGRKGKKIGQGEGGVVVVRGGGGREKGKEFDLIWQREGDEPKKRVAVLSPLGRKKKGEREKKWGSWKKKKGILYETYSEGGGKGGKAQKKPENGKGNALRGGKKKIHISSGTEKEGGGKSVY